MIAEWTNGRETMRALVTSYHGVFVQMIEMQGMEFLGWSVLVGRDEQV